MRGGIVVCLNLLCVCERRVRFSLLSWNIHGKNPVINTRISKIVPELERVPADILCLQEARRAKALLRTLPGLLEYSKIIPATKSNDNVILSKHHVERHGEIAFPTTWAFSLENALWADVVIAERTVRVYNCHFGIIGFGPSTRLEQLRYVLDHAERHTGPSIICGDLNTVGQNKGFGRVVLRTCNLSFPGEYTIEGEELLEEERYLLARVAEERGFREATDMTQATWRLPHSPWEPFNMKLDWLLVRGIDTPSVSLLPYVTDHKAIHAHCLLR